MKQFGRNTTPPLNNDCVFLLLFPDIGKKDKNSSFYYSQKQVKTLGKLTSLAPPLNSFHLTMKRISTSLS